MRGIEQFLQVDAATLGALKYAGTWNASTNTPTLASGVGVQGQYYVVSVAGNTNLDGETNWGVGDWAVFNGSVWQKVDGGSTGLLSTLTVTGNTYLATTSGNVGVGTTSPTNYANYTGVTCSNTNGGFIDLKSTSATVTSFVDSDAGTSRGSAGTRTNHAFAFVTNGTERMRITSAGNVGIGTTSPGSLLHLNSAAGGGDVPRLRFTNAGTGTGATDGMFVGISNTSQLDVWNFEASDIRFGTNNAERMRITSAGDVGIGTTGPNSPLEVRKDGDVGNGALAVNNADAAGLQSRAATRFVTSAGDVGYVGAHGAGTGPGIGFPSTMVVYGLLSSGVRIVASNASGSVQIAAGGAASNKIFLNISSAGNVVCNNAAIATNATDGFLYVPSCAGTPTGTPTAFTGRVPIVVDSTNNKLYFYSGGQWRDAGP